MLMCGNEDFVGSSVSTYLKSKNAEVTDVPWQVMVDYSARYRHRMMIFNIISHEQSYADFVSYINKNRFKVYDNAVVVIADDRLAKLCIELLYVEKVIVLTDKSPLRDFGRLTTLTGECWNPRLFRSQKRLSDREQQILSLLVSGYSPNEISDLISVSYKTIQTHKMRIITKLGLAHSTELNKLIVRFNHPFSFLS
ncbi:LuxR C-terminal-related transcriptional regulator [Citrobacter amalonaticus]|uniref:helix-turn-helix transcriptional regulator n=1 Tax=Citrobacter amalonaticus TaxID=35703 RepID=UPI00115AF3D1|nr:LuxR family transcriptional regulator [Citrobacter amalonaticus]QDK85119.1 LuxR family transcriptional regulator [Citrobacter amalonaticus]